MALSKKWFSAGVEKLSELLLGSDLQSRICAVIDMRGSASKDRILPTSFTVQIGQNQFNEKVKGQNVNQIERHLEEVAKAHILRKGPGYRTHSDRVHVEISPHFLTSNVRIVAEYPEDRAEPLPFNPNRPREVARAERPQGPKLAIPSQVTNFDGRAMETIVRPAEETEPPAAATGDPLPTAVAAPESSNDSDSGDDSEAEMETRVYKTGTDDEPMETMLGPGVTEEDVTVEGDMATVVRPVARVMYLLAQVDPETESEIETWMLDRNSSYTIGRSGSCDIHIAGDTISGKHARIEVDGAGKAFLSDDGSRNGTFLNDEEVTSPVRVSPGDEIRLTRKGAAYLVLRPPMG